MSIFDNIWGGLDKLGGVVTDAAGDVIRAAGAAEAAKLKARSHAGAEAVADQTPVGTPSGPQPQIILSAWQQMRTPLMIGGVLLLALIIWMAVR